MSDSDNSVDTDDLFEDQKAQDRIAARKRKRKSRAKATPEQKSQEYELTAARNALERSSQSSPKRRKRQATETARSSRRILEETHEAAELRRGSNAAGTATLRSLETSEETVLRQATETARSSRRILEESKEENEIRLDIEATRIANFRASSSEAQRERERAYLRAYKAQKLAERNAALEALSPMDQIIFLTEAACERVEILANLSEEEREVLRLDREAKRERLQTESTAFQALIRSCENSMDQVSVDGLVNLMNFLLFKTKPNGKREITYSEFTAFRVNSLQLEQQNPPRSDQLMFPERNALTALFLYYHRGGVEFTLPIRNFVDHSSEWSHEWLKQRANLSPQEVLNDLNEFELREECEESDLASCKLIENLMMSLSLLQQDPARHSTIIEKFRKQMDPDQPIFGCACCGRRSAIERDRREGDNSLLGGFVDVQVKHLNLLKYSPELVEEYNHRNIQTRKCRATFPVTDSNLNMDYWHLISNFVTITDPNVPGECLARICFTCNDSLLNWKVPDICIASGYDYGDIRKCDNHKELYPSMTVAEKMASSLARPYGVIVQLHMQNRIMNKLKTHMICMPFGGMETIGNRLNQSLPLSADILSEYLKIVFVGSSDTFKVTRNSLLAGMAHARVNIQVLFRKLLLLKNENARMLNISIPADVESIVYDYTSLTSLPAGLEASSLDDQLVPSDAKLASKTGLVLCKHKLIRAHEMMASSNGRDIASVRVAEEDENEFIVNRGISGMEDRTDQEEDGSPQDHSVTSEVFSSIISSASLLIQLDGESVDVSSIEHLNKFEIDSIALTVKATLAPGLVATVAVTDASDISSVSANPNPEIEERGVTSNVATSVLRIPVRDGDRVPLNEYTENARCMLDSFPHEYLLGIGVSETGPYSDEEIQHAMSWYTGCFEHNMEWLLYVFDKRQRMSVSRCVARKCKNNPKAMQEMSDLFGSQEFKDDLNEAMLDSNSDAAKKIQKSVSSFLRGVGSAVSFSKESRSAVLTNLYAMTLFYGLISLFYTFSMDDTNDVIQMRLCYSMNSNTVFPATSDLEFVEGSKTFKEVMETKFVSTNPLDQFEFNIPIPQHQKSQMASLNPVSTSRLYLFFQKVFVEELLGLSIENPNLKKTHPRVDSSLTEGYFASEYQKLYSKSRFTSSNPPLLQALSAIIPTEEQKKETLHSHGVAVTSLKPVMLQYAAGHDYLRNYLIHIIDSIFKTKIPAIIHFKQMCRRFAGGYSERMSLYLPSANDPDPSVNLKNLHKINNSSNEGTNIHGHVKPACVNKDKNNHFCRFAKKSPLVEKTCIVQLTNDQAGDLVISDTLDPIKESCSVRNRIPSTGSGLVDDDDRCFIYVTERPTIQVQGEEDVNSRKEGDEAFINLHTELLNEERFSEWGPAMIDEIVKADLNFKTISDDEKIKIVSLTLEQAIGILKRVQGRNGLTVDYNEVSTAIFRCNTACYLMGSVGQCIAVFMYLAAYITKDAHELSHSIAAIGEARDHVKEHPTIPRNNETLEERNLMKFSQRLLNGTQGGMSEMAQTTIAYSLIGGFDCIFTDKFSYSHAYCIRQCLNQYYPSPNSILDEASEEYKCMNCPIYALPSGGFQAISQSQFYMERENHLYRHNNLILVTQCKSDFHEFYIDKMDDNGQVDSKWNDELKILAYDFLDADNRYYSTLDPLNKREFDSCVSLRPFVDKDEKKSMMSEMMDPVRLSKKDKTKGRLPSQKFILHQDNPLFESHCHVLEQKQKVPIMAGGPPPNYPHTTMSSHKNSRIFDKSKNLYGSYIIANYWPFSADCPPLLPDGTLLTSDWNGFSSLLDFLYLPNTSFINQGRLAEIENVSRSSTDNPVFGRDHKRMITQYRYLKADNLNDPDNKFDFVPVFGTGSYSGLSNSSSEESKAVDEEAVRMIREIYEDNRMGAQDEINSDNKNQERQRFYYDIKTSTSSLFKTVRELKVAQNESVNENPQQRLNARQKLFNDVSIESIKCINDNIEKMDVTARLLEHNINRERNENNPSFISREDFETQYDAACESLNRISISDMNSEEKTERTANIEHLFLEEFKLYVKTNFSADLNDQQIVVVKRIFDYLENEHDDLAILVVGGPGTGKTFTMNVAAQMSKVPFVCSAVAGSAAVNLIGGKTLCNLLGFTPMKKGSEPSQNVEMDKLSSNHCPIKLENLIKLFEELNSVFVLDEVSMLTIIYFYHVHARFRNLRQDDARRLKPFGGFPVILSGDFNQIEGIGLSLPKMIMRLMMNPNGILSPKEDLMREAALLFLKFTRYELTLNVRAAEDEVHVERVRQVTDYNSHQPISNELIHFFESIILKEEDVSVLDSPWINQATCLTASNVERFIITELRATLYSLVNDEPLIKYPLAYRAGALAQFTEVELQTIRETYPETNGYFVRGGPCVCCLNQKPEAGLANGTIGVFNSLRFDDSHPLYADTQNKLNNAINGEPTYILQSPTHVLIEFKPMYPFLYREMEKMDKCSYDTLFPGDDDYICVAIPWVNTKKSDSVNNVVVGDKVKKEFSFSSAGVEPLFACTYDKAQGKTLLFVILCLGANMWKSALLAHIYVGLTRVKNGQNLRVWPAAKYDWDRLKHLEYSKEVKCLAKAYNSVGKFDEELYKAAYLELQLLEDERNTLKNDQRTADALALRNSNGGGRGRGRGRGRDLGRGRGPSRGRVPGRGREQLASRVSSRTAGAADFARNFVLRTTSTTSTTIRAVEPPSTPSIRGIASGFTFETPLAQYPQSLSEAVPFHSMERNRTVLTLDRVNDAIRTYGNKDTQTWAYMYFIRKAFQRVFSPNDNESNEVDNQVKLLLDNFWHNEGDDYEQERYEMYIDRLGESYHDILRLVQRSINIDISLDSLLPNGYTGGDIQEVLIGDFANLTDLTNIQSISGSCSAVMFFFAQMICNLKNQTNFPESQNDEYSHLVSIIEFVGIRIVSFIYRVRIRYREMASNTNTHHSDDASMEIDEFQDE